MIKVLFNSDGSLKAFDLPQYITQGSSGEIDALRLEVAVDGVDLVSDDLIVKAQFTLPNGDTNALYSTRTSASSQFMAKYMAKEKPFI